MLELSKVNMADLRRLTELIDIVTHIQQGEEHEQQGLHQSYHHQEQELLLLQ